MEGIEFPTTMIAFNVKILLKFFSISIHVKRGYWNKMNICIIGFVQMFYLLNSQIQKGILISYINQSFRAFATLASSQTTTEFHHQHFVQHRRNITMQAPDLCLSIGLKWIFWRMFPQSAEDFSSWKILSSCFQNPSSSHLVCSNSYEGAMVFIFSNFLFYFLVNDVLQLRSAILW